jgi:hypothetical protein
VAVAVEIQALEQAKQVFLADQAVDQLLTKMLDLELLGKATTEARGTHQITMVAVAVAGLELQRQILLVRLLLVVLVTHLLLLALLFTTLEEVVVVAGMQLEQQVAMGVAELVDKALLRMV